MVQHTAILTTADQ